MDDTGKTKTRATPSVWHIQVFVSTRGAVGFSVLRFWLFFSSFSRCFSICFSVLVQNTYGFSDLVFDAIFGFFLFGFQFVFDLSNNYAPSLISNEARKANVIDRSA